MVYSGKEILWHISQSQILKTENLKTTLRSAYWKNHLDEEPDFLHRAIGALGWGKIHEKHG